MEHITVTQLKERLEKGENLRVIDVREAWEYAELNVGARSFPLSTLMQQIHELEPWKNDDIVIHCKSGTRSQQAVLLLQQHGFTRLYNLQGGIEAWIAHYGNTTLPNH